MARLRKRFHNRTLVLSCNYYQGQLSVVVVQYYLAIVKKTPALNNSDRLVVLRKITR